MKTLRHLRIIAAAVLLLLFACRQEITTIDDHNSKREQEFFRGAYENTSRLKQGNFIVNLLEKENEEIHFIEKLKDKNGIPIWDKMLVSSHPSNTGKASVSDTLNFAIPLTEDRRILSSVMIVVVVDQEVITIKNVDNTDLYNFVNNAAIPAAERETAMLNFIYLDKKSFGTTKYINIPTDLFPDIALRAGEVKKSMTVSSVSQEDDTNNFVAHFCVTYVEYCEHCNGDVIEGYSTKCFTVWVETGGSGGGGDGSGDTGSGDTGDGGSGGGDTGGSSPCSRGAWYKIDPPGCGGGGDEELPPAVLALKGAMLNLGAQFDIFAYEGYLTYNVSIAQKFNTYLLQNNNAQGAAFVMWGLEFLSQNTGTTWTQFENWFMGESEGQDGEYVDPNLITYETPIIQQNLPSLYNWTSNFPKIEQNNHYYQMPSPNVYQLVGGSIYSAHISPDPLINKNYQNACAIRGSRALLYSGINIPVLKYGTPPKQVSQKGGDGKNYILAATSFNKFMIDTFGDTPYKLEGDDANDSQKVKNLLTGKSGIYVIINNNSTIAGYSGHVDTIINGICIGHAYTKPKGGVKSIRIWILN